MLLERIRIAAFELWMLLYMVTESIHRFRFARMRRQGREAEVAAMIDRKFTDWAHWVLDNLHCRLEVEGSEHIPHGEPFVVVANHQSKYDIPVLVAALGRAVGFVAKRELFWVPGMAYWMREIQMLPLDRRSVVRGADTLAQLGPALKAHNRAFVIFPEGTRTRAADRSVQPFKRGAIRLASEHDLPVLPLALDGTWQLDQTATMAVTRHGGRVVRIRIEPLRRLEGDSAPARRAFVDALYETIRSNREAIRVEWPQS